MKKLLFICLVGLSISSCYRQKPVVIGSNDSTTVDSINIDSILVDSVNIDSLN